MKMVLGALFAAVFGLVSNIPGLAALQLVPGVPFTLQVLVIALMGLALGWRWGLLSFGTVLLLTFCGVPMMSGGRAAAALIGPTCGYIYGWVFLLLLLGLYTDCGKNKKPAARKRLYFPVVTALGLVGMPLCYACGAAVLSLQSGQGLGRVPALWAASLVYLPPDLLKILLAAAIARAIQSHPAFKTSM